MYIYLLYSTSCNSTYIGITNDPDRRLKQHNGIISGGAKATRKVNDWIYDRLYMIDDNHALSIEWYAKHKKTKNGKWTRTTGLKERRKRLDDLIQNEH